MRTTRNWIDKLIHKLGAIAPVAVEEYDDVAFRPQRRHSGGARTTVSAMGFDDARASLARAFRGSICAAVIDHDDVGQDFCGHDFTHDPGNRLFLVERRNDD